MQLRLDFETPQFLHSLFANDLSLLKHLDEQLGLRAVTRDGWILFDGKDAALQKAKELFSDLEETRRGGADITAKDFKTALTFALAGSGCSLSKMARIQLLGKRDGKPVIPRTPRQAAYVEAMRQSDITFGLGPAGTGKTYLAMAMALTLLKNGDIRRLVLTRPAVEAGEALGFLPGDFREKIAPYLRPLYDALHDILSPEQGQRYLEDGTIEIAPLAYMRGRTLSRSFVILDEAQNTSPEQMFMFLTRLGENSRCVVTGDASQSDLAKGRPSGLAEALSALRSVPGVLFIEFSSGDVLRHPVVARIIDAYERHREK